MRPSHRAVFAGFVHPDKATASWPRAVVDGMREQLRDPRLIEDYLRRYNEQRCRLAAETIREREKLERGLAEAKREFDRMFLAYRKGYLSLEEADERLPASKAEPEWIVADLASAGEEPKVIALHPTATADPLRTTCRRSGTSPPGCQTRPAKVTRLGTDWQPPSGRLSRACPCTRTRQTKASK